MTVRCRLTSLGLGEPLRGTATHAPAWLLLEHPGPWGYKALDREKVPSGLAEALARTSAAAGVRVNLIRRHHRPARGGSAGTHAFLASPAHGWVVAAVLDDPHEILAVDLAALARGERPPADAAPGGRRWREHEGPLFVVCCHGRKDPCCAENGRPVARAVAARFPARTWETTHLGGDRFSANMVCFPHGLYFGRVPAEGAAAIATAYRDGEIDLDHYRGRCAWPGAVQAAEAWVREETKRTGVDAVRLVASTVEGDVTTSAFAVDNAVYVVEVRAAEDPRPRLVSCRADEETRPEVYELVRLSGPHIQS